MLCLVVVPHARCLLCVCLCRCQVPLNQPQRALDMLSRIISGEPFDSSSRKVDETTLATTEIDAAPRVATE